MHKWPVIFIGGAAIWFAADLTSAFLPRRAAEIWTIALLVAAVAGAVGGMRGKRPRAGLAWLLRYLGTFAICAALGASLAQLGGMRSVIAVDVAGAATIASLYLTTALWTSLLRTAFLVSGTVAWAAGMAAYFWLPDLAHLVMAGAGALLLAVPGIALHRMLPPPPRRAAC